MGKSSESEPEEKASRVLAAGRFGWEHVKVCMLWFCEQFLGEADATASENKASTIN